MSRMKECPQDPRFHAEGSVYAHTRMVQKDLDNMLSKLKIKKIFYLKVLKAFN